MALRVIDITHQ